MTASPGFKIEIDDLHFAYPKSPEVLRHLQLSVQSGECIAIQGEVGSGKTTLLKIIATLLAHQQGTIRFNDLLTSSDAETLRPQIGWVPASETGMLPFLTGRENLEFFGDHDPAILEQHLQEWRTILPVEGALNTLFYRCSSGMRRSLLLMRSLIKEPKLLLLDEPTRSLDRKSQQQFWDQLLSQKVRPTIIFSTHDPDEARKADRQYQLHRGTLVTST